MAAFETKNVHITLLLGHWLQKSLKRIETSSMPIELWALNFEKKVQKMNWLCTDFFKKKGGHNKIASLQQFFIALFSPYLDHYSAARPVPIVIRPIVVLVTLSHTYLDQRVYESNN